jgi:hypothetical protein
MDKLNFNRRKFYIALGLTAATISAIVLIRKRNFGKRLFLYISSKLENRENLYGNIKDFQDIFNGKEYLDKVDDIIKKTNPDYPYIKLKDEFVTKYRKELYDAMEAKKLSNLGTGLGTDEEAVISTIKRLRDKVALSQVSESYKNAYGRNLLSVLIDELGLEIKYMEEIYNDISIKMPFRLAEKNK